MMRSVVLVPLLFLCAIAISAGDSPMLAGKENLAVLKCDAPTEDFRFAGSNAAGQLFHPGEPVNLKAVFKKGAFSGSVDFGLEIQEITTRDPNVRLKEGFTDTAGYAPKLSTEGAPIKHSFKAAFGDKPEAEVDITNVPVPSRFGTYALILTHGEKRQFFATLCRVPARRPDSNLENTPIFSEFQMFDNHELMNARAETNARMGIRGLRLESSWAENEDGTYDWKNLDRIFEHMEKHQIQIMFTLGGNRGWQWPFKKKQTPAAVGPNWDGNPYMAQADWVCEPSLYPRYGKWITAMCERYWKGGKGALWGLENYNEPWEGGGISGWARDAQQYRAIQKLIATSARKVDPRIKICAASSIMNTEDKFYADGTREMDAYVDVFTDHYVLPSMCYGPMVAKAHGKESVETETWFVNSEYMLPQVVQFIASGQKRLSPWHPRVLFDTVPGSKDRYLIPAPVTAATAAFNYFIAGKSFEKLAYHTHLPWAFQFGKDDDKDGVLVLFGQLISIGSDDPRERLWAQVDSSPGGTMTIENGDGLLKFHDLAGNPIYEGQKTVTLPMSIYATYVKSDKGPAAAAARIKQAKIEGKRPVEILPRDFTTRVDGKGVVLNVAIHNCLNRAISGKLTPKGPAEIQLGTTEQAVTLEAGETKTFAFPVTSAKASPANNYPFTFDFTSDAGNASYSEAMNAALIVKGARTIDANLDDWNDVPGVTVISKLQKADAAENARRPWLELKDQQPDGNFGEFKMAWDENFLYVAARVNDKSAEKPTVGMEGRDENAYFHSKASDTVAPFDKFLKEFPGRSFAEVPYVYCYSPENPRNEALPRIHFRRDRLHIALDVTDDWHDFEPTTNSVPKGFHAVPDSDYEYALYPTRDGKAELWRLSAPGVPRRHDFPRTGNGTRTTGPVPGAKFAVKREGNVYIYEMAIPKSELSTLKLNAGTTIGVMLRGGNSDGPHVDYGNDKAVVKVNGLTLKPYWERSSNCGVRWTLVD